MGVGEEDERTNQVEPTVDDLRAGREAALWHLMLPGEFRWELDKVVHSHNPSTPEAEAGGLRVQDQPGLHIECLSSG